MGVGLNQATSGEGGSPGSGQPNDPTDSGTDVGNGSTTVGGTTVIIQGSGPSTGYSYDIISLYGGVGSAYLALNNSNISCNSSVAVFNRNNSFAVVNTSAGNFSNCCSYAGNKGFIAYDSSKAATYTCISVLSAYNYSSVAASSMYANLSASVFPFLYGVYVSNTSSFISNEYETMTTIFSDNAPTPTHYRSGQNSFCTNNNVALTSKTSAGLSGPVMNGKHLSFIWSQIWRNSTTGLGFPIHRPPPSGTDAMNIFESTALASYRYVPITHSTDYYQLPFSSNGAAGTNIPAGNANIDTSALVLLYAEGRNCYTSVKQPWYLFPPEDGSGLTAVNSLQATYNVFNIATGSFQ